MSRDRQDQRPQNDPGHKGGQKTNRKPKQNPLRPRFRNGPAWQAKPLRTTAAKKIQI